MFLQYILKEDEDSLISKFVHAQDSNPVKNDWSLTIRKDLEELSLNLNYEEIKLLSKQNFKSRVYDAITKISFEFLLKEKSKLKKVSHIKHANLKIQQYLLPNSTSVKMARFIFHARNRMLDIKVNQKNKNCVDMVMVCSTCRDPNTEDSQEHLLQCISLNNQTHNFVCHRCSKI